MSWLLNELSPVDVSSGAEVYKFISNEAPSDTNKTGNLLASVCRNRETGVCARHRASKRTGRESRGWHWVRVGQNRLRGVGGWGGHGWSRHFALWDPRQWEMREWSPPHAAEMLTLTLSPLPGLQKRNRGGSGRGVQTCQRDRSRSMSTNTVSKQTQLHTHKLAWAQPKHMMSCVFSIWISLSALSVFLSSADSPSIL